MNEWVRIYESHLFVEVAQKIIARFTVQTAAYKISECISSFFVSHVPLSYQISVSIFVTISQASTVHVARRLAAGSAVVALALSAASLALDLTV